MLEPHTKFLPNQWKPLIRLFRPRQAVLTGKVETISRVGVTDQVDSHEPTGNHLTIGRLFSCGIFLSRYAVGTAESS